jgi:diguanylate cyclase (GGDEF)-like protein/PAS domain S-box-containing protein
MENHGEDFSYKEIYGKYKQAIDEADIAVWEWNLKENKFFASEAWEKITGYDLNAFNNLFDFIRNISIYEDIESAVIDLNFLMEGKVSFYRSEYRIVTKNNQVKWILFKGNMIKAKNGEIMCLFGLVSDITEEKDRNGSFTKKAYYDSLTELPNRSLFLIDIKNILNKTIQLNKKGAIILLDSDNFKSINDTLSHDYGDLMLKVFSQLLSICTKDYGKLYRLGGDEFIVLIDEFDSIEKLKELCNMVLNYCENPFEVNEKQLYMTTSIGISIFPQDSCDANDLLMKKLLIWMN